MTLTESPPTTSADTTLTGWAKRLATPAVIAVTVAAAVAVNLVIWAIGELAGGSFEFTADGKVESAAPGGVVFLTAVPLLVGLTATAVVARWWPAVIRSAQVVGSLLAIATIGLTLTSDFDTASTISLSLMHVALVPFIILGLEATKRP